MADFTAYAVLSLVIAMLTLSVWRQFNKLGPRGQILDGIGILPQWKFFAQSVMANNDDIFDDFHLLVRLADHRGKTWQWEEIFWNAERTWLEMFWNPDLRPRGEIQLRLWQVSSNRFNTHDPRYQTSLAYLTLLRHCLDCVELTPHQAMQFAIAATTGREERPVTVRFVSSWHIR